MSNGFIIIYMKLFLDYFPDCYTFSGEGTLWLLFLVFALFFFNLNYLQILSLLPPDYVWFILLQGVFGI